MKRHHRRITLYVLFVLALLGLWAFWHYENKKYTLPPIEIETEQGNANTQNPLTNNNPDLPKDLLLSVPFTPQAPTANWDELHNEACEEASSLMAGLYFAGDKDTNIPASEAESEIGKLIKWEQANFGYSLDTDSPETAHMIEQVYGLKTKLLENFTIDDLKTELNQNHLILISTDGRLLGNPNYRQPGPPHHMLVIKGYTSTNIITNDPGTRKGLNYPFSFKTIYYAAGDWDHKAAKVDLDHKVAIIVWRE